MSEAETAPKSAASISGWHVIEAARPLRDSGLWQLQRGFYEREGAAAWGSGAVPHYITCNPYIADAYARTVMAFLRDCRAAGALPQGAAAWVIELGSGSGRFAYQFTTRLRTLLRDSHLDDVKLTVVMTDFTGTNVRSWQDHPWLARLISEGVLAVAEFDAAAPGPLRLSDGTVLDVGATSDPVVTVANYVLDSLPHDCFTLDGGAVYANDLSILASTPDLDAATRDGLDGLELRWEHTPATAPYLDDPELDRIVTHYVDTLDDTTVLVPTAAIDTIRYLSTLTSGPSLFLVADKGHPRIQDLLSQPEASIVYHGGCFSLMVNFDALCRFVEGRGGRSFQPRHRPPHLPVVALVLGGEPDAFRETGRAFVDELEVAGPDDFFALKTALVPQDRDLTVEQVLAFLRLARWDAYVLVECFGALLTGVETAPESLYPDVERSLDEVWDRYFPIGDAIDVALSIGLVMSTMRYYREAITYFERSIELRGVTASSAFGLAVAHYGLRDLGLALKHVEDALDLEPTFSSARSLRATLQAALGAGTPRASTVTP